jgi:hypothetical protein
VTILEEMIAIPNVRIQEVVVTTVDHHGLIEKDEKIVKIAVTLGQ